MYNIVSSILTLVCFYPYQLLIYQYIISIITTPEQSLLNGSADDTIIFCANINLLRPDKQLLSV